MGTVYGCIGFVTVMTATYYNFPFLREAARAVAIFSKLMMGAQ
jgi:hypothetical protein